MRQVLVPLFVVVFVAGSFSRALLEQSPRSDLAARKLPVLAPVSRPAIPPPGPAFPIPPGFQHDPDGDDVQVSSPNPLNQNETIIAVELYYRFEPFYFGPSIFDWSLFPVQTISKRAFFRPRLAALQSVDS